MIIKNEIIGIMILTAGLLAPVFPAGAAQAEKQEQTVTGTLVAINSKTRFIIIRHESRVIKFKGSAVICREWEHKLNTRVKIVYQRMNDGSLSVLQMTQE